jgi:DNA-directed RNA polymerase subunit RPC12/RpoP
MDDEIESDNEIAEQIEKVEQIETKELKKSTYECEDCKSDVQIGNKDSIVCKKCGCRIILKKRIPIKVYYLAR